MRILTIVENLKPGGTQRTAQNCAVGYLRHGHDSAVLSYLGGGPREQPIVEAGCPLFVGSPDDFPGPAVDAAAEWNPEVVHLHRFGMADPHTGRILDRLRERLGRRIPTVETNHFARPDYSRARDLIDVHVQISPWCLWIWRRWTSTLRPRPLGVMIPHLVDPKAFRVLPPEERLAARAEFGVPPDAIVCGRTGQPHGSWPSEQIEAFRLAAMQRPDLWLVLAGFPTRQSHVVEALPPDIRSRVIVLPFISGDDERLNRLYNTFDVFLHMTRIGETFGLVLCEAQLAGAPCVTLSTPTKGNSQKYVVGHERGGLVVADTRSAADAILRLAADPDERAALAQGGAAWVRRVCDPDRIILRFLELLQLTAAAKSRAAIAAALADGDWITDVPEPQIRELLSNMLGRHRWRELAVGRIVASPWVFRPYLWYRNRRTQG